MIKRAEVCRTFGSFSLTNEQPMCHRAVGCDRLSRWHVRRSYAVVGRHPGGARAIIESQHEVQTCAAKGADDAPTMLWLDSTNATRHRRSLSAPVTPDRSGSGSPESTVRSWSLISLRSSAVSAIPNFPHRLILPTPPQFESATTLKAVCLAIPALASASRAKRHRNTHVRPATRSCVFVSPGEMCFVRAPPRLPQHLGSPTPRAPPLDQTAPC